ncbi:MAG: hypothetical protein LUD72_05785 [Bacteroidales bacterium]|nr:hypothetical protein [Bacteroidales bacterium]
MIIKPEFVGFDYKNEADTIADINRVVTTLINTPAGTCPGDRSYGISWEYVDSPTPVAQNQVSLEVIEKLEIYEPRVEVENIDFVSAEDGQLVMLLRLARNEDYEEE